jgi:hypothetical protein
MLSRAPIGVCIVLAAAALSAPAAAEQEVTYDADKIDLAKVYMEEGQEHYLAGRYNEASITFMKGYSVIPLSAFLFNTAVCYEKMAMAKHAAEMFERYLDAEPDAPDKDKILERIASLEEAAKTQPEPEPIPEPPKVVVEKIPCGEKGQPPCEGEGQTPPSAASEMKSMINVRTTPAGARVVITAYPDIPVVDGTSPLAQSTAPGKYVISVEHPKYKTAETVLDVKGGNIYVVVVEMSQGAFLGYLNVRTSKPGAKVYIDDKKAGSRGDTPMGLSIPAGEHKVWVELPGFKPLEKTVEVGIGEEATVTLELERVDFGLLVVKSNVDGSVIVDKAKGSPGATPFKLDLPAGTHHVLVGAKGMKPVKKNVSIDKGMQTTLLVRLNPRPKKMSAWISFGLMAACVTAGAVLAHYANVTHDALDRDASAGTLTEGDGRIGRGLGLSIGADVSFVMAGIFGALGIVYLVRDKLPDSEVKMKGPEEMADIAEAEE